MFEYFYHEILRRTIVGFGSLFNEIYIKHENKNDEVVSTIKVPLAYGPTQKFLARIEQVPDLNQPFQMTLPRMSFEFVGLNYDASRKVTTTQSFLAKSVDDATDIRKTFMPVPYNMDFELSIYTKLNDDMLQIIEQIVPYFQPAYTLTVDLVDKIGEKRDIPITLNNITMQDDYEGNFTTRRALIYTLKFTAKTYLFGPVSASVSADIIKKTSIGYIAGDSTRNPSREVTYSVEPRATKAYSGTVASTLSENIDNSTTNFAVASTSSISVGTYLVIDDEQMKVTRVDGNKVVVVRGADGTTKDSHVSGTQVFKIVPADNALIEAGDDFGFTFSLDD